VIFAALRNVPVVGLPYSSKVEVFLEELGLTIPPIKLVNAGRLIAYIDHYWDTQKEVKKIISSKLPELKRRAEETRNLLLNFIEKNL
jgi:polysaccharide pyruvyl transferase WcaK-like protein